jgi:hypothetical protein
VSSSRKEAVKRRERKYFVRREGVGGLSQLSNLSKKNEKCSK